MEHDCRSRYECDWGKIEDCLRFRSDGCDTYWPPEILVVKDEQPGLGNKQKKQKFLKLVNDGLGRSMSGV